MTAPNLFTPPHDPMEPPTTVVIPPGRGRRRWPALVGAVLVGALLVAGVGFALTRGDSTPPAPVANRSGAPTAAPSAGPEAGPGPGRGGRAGAGRGGGLGGPLGADTLLVGALVSVAPDAVVVAQDGGGQLTVHPNAQTRVLGAGARALSDLQPGQRVTVRVSGTGAAATAVTVRAENTELIGTVTALAGNTATVLAADGLSVPVDVAAVTPKPAVGDLVRVRGRATGGTLTADRVRTLPKAS